MKSKYVKRVSTRLTASEVKSFRVVRRFVVGFCGKVSDVEVLRFLVCNWLSPHGKPDEVVR